MRKIASLVLLATALGSSPAQAKLEVITTTTDLQALASEVGGDLTHVESIAKGTQDPHYVEAKPSFMLKASRADLLISIGLDLEVGWLPSIVRGARNPRINPGSPGYLEVGALVEPLEIPQGRVSRAEGDIHPLGNPHVTLDPIRAGQIAIKIGERMGQLDPAHSADYLKTSQALAKRLTDKTVAWQSRIERSGVKKVITYHKTLTYFLNRFHLENPAILEPKPGIPPTSGHVLEVIKLIQSQGIPLILVENFFDPTVTRKITEDAPSVRSKTVAVAVGGAPGIDRIDDLYESLVQAIERK